MPIHPIDRFVSALHRQRADELLLETGKPVRLRSGREERVILAQEVRSDQIELLLRDVLPEDCQRSFALDGEIGFPYNAPTGPVLVRVRRSGDRLGVCVSHYTVPASRTAPDARAKAPEAPIREVRSAAPPASVSPSPLVAQAAPARMPPPASVTGTGAHPVMRGSKQPATNGSGWGYGGVQAQVDRVPHAIQAIELPPEPAPAIGSTPVAPPRPMGGDTGPIELDLGSTGSISIASPIELQQIASVDMVEEVEESPFAAPVPAPAPAPVRVEPRAPAPAKRTITAGSSQPHKVRGKIDPLLYALVEGKGSDLHLTAGLPPRMRKDGDMGPVPGFEEPLESHTIEAWLMEIAPPKSRQKFEETSDADYGYELPGTARLRVNAFRDRRGAGGVFRVIPATVLTADQLNLPNAVRDLTTLHKGLVVVTGPTGSGKSTTLAAMVDLANKTRADHIITIEDPVEFVHVPQKCLINQREVHSDTESFSSGLRAALREDPDIILVGEMRDLETIAIAVETAETGHLVFGTLHTTTAVSTVDRIVDQFPSDRQQQIRVMLSSALKGVVAQTLCRKIGGGRVAALEILLVVPAVANLIREGKTFQIPSILQTSKAIGMQTLNDALLKLVEDRLIAPEEALRCAVARPELRALLERAGMAPK